MFGLLGRSLSHSHSPEIHRLFGNNDYHLFETDDPKAFFNSVDFNGLNITIPYKESVIPLLDKLDPVALAIGAVNTVVKKDGLLVGYNTDAYGFEQLLVHSGIDPYQKNVLLLGNGGAAKSCTFVLKKLGAKKIIKLCRSAKSSDEYFFSEIDRVTDAEIIINSTPVGMYPENDGYLPIDLSQFSRLVNVVDLIYNPLYTNLLLDAKSLGINVTNGLYMLVAQAAKANELFTGTSPTEIKTSEVFSTLNFKSSNIVLIGLPGGGKSTIASLLAPKMKKTFVDCDEEISKAVGTSIQEIFSNFGEPYFRNLEFELVKELYWGQGLIIATGGGMVENTKLMRLLQQNGVIVFLDRSIDSILKENIQGRPLLRNADDLLALAKKRRPLYENYADIRYVSSCSSAEAEVSKIEEKLYEYFSYKRT